MGVPCNITLYQNQILLLIVTMTKIIALVILFIQFNKKYVTLPIYLFHSFPHFLGSALGLSQYALLQAGHIVGLIGFLIVQSCPHLWQWHDGIWNCSIFIPIGITSKYLKLSIGSLRLMLQCCTASERTIPQPFPGWRWAPTVP